MKKCKKLFFFLVCLFLANQSVCADKTDPNLLASGGFGYLISQNPEQTLWWVEGSYKIMKDAPVPTRKRGVIELASAKNEWESFILISHPVKNLKNVNVRLSEMKAGKKVIPASAFTVRDVEYVNVSHATDYYGFEGDWPDPLPTSKGNRTLRAGENNSFWISIKTPKDAKAGKYKGSVTVSGEGWSEEIPVSLEVWDFTLPDTPTLRSGFGLNFNNVTRYNNLYSAEQKEKAFANYMKAFSDYKIAPFDPFLLSPVKETITGVEWQGGFFDSKEKHGGKYAYKVVDGSNGYNAEASTRHLYNVQGDKDYKFSWWAKAQNDNQPYVVGIECFDKNGELIWFENRYEEFAATKEWKEFSYDLGHFKPSISKVKVHLFPSKPLFGGDGTGTVWFDDLVLASTEKNAENLLPCGNFEIDINNIDIKLDFTEYNKAAKKYTTEYGFNSFHCQLKGLGGGTYWGSSKGVFEGFEQGTDEYNHLMQRYLSQIQNNLETNGLLGKDYIYWFDEPGDKDYPFIHETNAMLKKYAPKMTTFLTEHVPGHDISDVTDISCCLFDKYNKEKSERIYANGKACWSYLCCAPKSPWISEFIDSDAINFRMWIWASYKLGMSGILIWQTTYWNSPEATPSGKLQNPWEEPMSWVTTCGTPIGKQAKWGNGDGRLFYPENRNVNTDHNAYNSEAVPCVRLEILRDGIEDYEYFMMVEKLLRNAKGSKAVKAEKLLQIPDSVFKDGTHFTKDPQILLNYRRNLAKAIMSLK